MHHASAAYRARFVLTLSAIVIIGAGVAPSDVDPPESMTRRINDAIGLTRSEMFTLDVPDRPEPQMTVRVATDAGDISLNLYVHSLRAPGYQLLVQRADGTIEPVTPGPVRTLRGGVAGEPESVVAASLKEDGLHAFIRRADGREQWIEPVAPHVQDAPAVTHVLYDGADVLPTGGVCGTADAVALDEAAAGLSIGGRAPVSPAGATLCVADLACDADQEYYVAWGSNVLTVEAQISAVTNAVNVIYERDLGLTHVITTILVRAGVDPYTSTSDGYALLCEFITEWTNNQTGIARDLAQLFTGRVPQDFVGGIAADLGDVCNPVGDCVCNGINGTDGSYCFVRNPSGSAFQTFLSAHEMGHLWGGLHNSCNGCIMNPSVVTTSHFDAANIFNITTYRDSLTCLDGDCLGAPVTNDLCVGAIDVVEGDVPYTTLAVGTECPGLPAACDEGLGGGLVYGWDVWFRYTAGCTGDATLDICAIDYDGRLAVYEDHSCPPLDEDVVACDDDFCGPGAGSLVTFPVSEGASYLVRVGGWVSQGTGTLSISCAGALPCPADADASGEVGITDFLAVLTQWETSCPCSADIDRDGAVDIVDFLLVLADWGACP